ncbi:hypothetical protein QH494_25825 [Sphingomonas sp. AR_OL41]|uniref:hypothetical protein n=1 Tax=Sphingomonas sp. AR_OL41 TaxID=3042729 RepID=UPI0024815982|nr:hypothetical protein [Sphingomonas sp. AR_OL41]MDH7975618.1 hypothetical protein [Sphingomonas sp. AR_OL41]
MTGEFTIGQGSATRLVTLPLMFDLVAAPLLFGWLLLRRGYAPSLRRIFCVYALLSPAIALFVAAVSLVARSAAGISG